MFKQLAFAGLAALVYADDSSQTPQASIKLTCKPETFATDTPFFVNLAYENNIKRPLAIHVDVLQADTNQYITGDVVKVNGANGDVTARLQIPTGSATPVKFNAFLTPQDESWPNTLAFTSFSLDTGAKTTAPCAPLKNTAKAGPKPDFNYIVLAKYPGGMPVGQRTPVTVQYNYQDSTPAMLNLQLVRNNDNSAIASTSMPAEQGQHSVRMPLDVPGGISTDPVHLEAYLIPQGKDAAESIAQDRAWSTSVMYTRLRKA